jgi:hypothetical protein
MSGDALIGGRTQRRSVGGIRGATEWDNDYNETQQGTGEKAHRVGLRCFCSSVGSVRNDGV